MHTLLRATEERFRPPQIVPHRSLVTPAQTAAIGKGAGGPQDRADILRERGAGRTPTIVLGGLVPDAVEQVFLLRRFLLRSGDLYYVHYSRAGFSLDLLCAQLDDLVAELSAAGQPPVILAVSFGAGVALEWLRRARLAGRNPPIGGIVLVSPVTCAADVIGAEERRAPSLLGRALQPFLAPEPPASTAVEKARTLLRRMFEAGAQNRAALQRLMTSAEAERLRHAVTTTIRSVSVAGACARAKALVAMHPPTDYFSLCLLPLTNAPALILFAEREDAVVDRDAPVRFVFDRVPGAYFPRSSVQYVVAKPGAAPVQHASLIFHAFEFRAPLQAFYQRVRRSPFAFAA
ncbi:MAG TPA: hypothetical protein VHD62_13200 [Opitutaceae bacterium]|nr:hypothetical protein [Opitutaceae bacterium]